MKVLVFCKRDDEQQFFKKYSMDKNLDLSFVSGPLTADNIEMTKGYEAIWILTTCKITAEIAKILKNNGIKYIVSRAAGTDHIDVKALAENGIKAANVPFYSPNAISEHTVLLALSILRNLHREINMVANGNFRLDGLKGRELRTMKVGVFGTGRIGFETIKILKGFGCEVLAYDIYPQEKVKEYASYESRDTLFKECDMLLFHCPLTDDNYHMVNKDTIGMMKDGVYLINTARGGLFDYDAVLEGLKGGKISALGFDVYENERTFLRKDMGDKKIEDDTFNELLSMENVIFTAHMSFYTDKAIESMIETAMNNLDEYEKTGKCKFEIVK